LRLAAFLRLAEKSRGPTAGITRMFWKLNLLPQVVRCAKGRMRVSDAERGRLYRIVRQFMVSARRLARILVQNHR